MSLYTFERWKLDSEEQCKDILESFFRIEILDPNHYGDIVFYE
jgi:hypothetical protein